MWKFLTDKYAFFCNLMLFNQEDLMDYLLTEEQIMLRDLCREVAERKDPASGSQI
jgi:hypothetical protein